MAKKKVEKPFKNKSLFDIIDGLFKKVKWNELTEIDKKTFSPFVTNIALSMNMEFTGLINYLQQFNIQYMSPKEAYKVFLDVLPNKNKFCPWIKSSVKLDERITPELVNLLCKHEHWSSREAQDNVTMILNQPNGIENLKEYIKRFGVDDKELKSKYKLK